MNLVGCVYLSLLLTAIMEFSSETCQTYNLEYKTENVCDYYKCEYKDVPITYFISCEDIESSRVETTLPALDIKRIVMDRPTDSTIAIGTFQDYVNLQFLKISDGSIEDILPAAFNGLSHLENLDLTNNRLAKLPKGIFNSLTMLTELQLPHNRIHTIEEHSLLGLKNLKNLSLSNNAVSNITELYNVCSKLEVLDLSYNKISDLISFKNFSRLQTLMLNNNLILRLPYDMVANTDINNLDLSYNLIESIDENVFVGLSKLENLSFASNELSNLQQCKLPIGLFRETTSLKYLNISQAKLRTISVGSFTGLEYLLSLDLSFNNISYLPKGIFHDLERLKELYLNDNSFPYFDYDGPGKLDKIDLNNNPWHCDSLSNITKQLTGTEIVRGITYNTPNVFGIDCVENQYEKHDSKDHNSVEDIVREKLDQGRFGQYFEITLNYTIKEYRDFFAEVRNDFKTSYQEFSERFLESFRATWLTLINSLKLSTYEEGHQFNLKLTESTVDNIYSEKSTSKESVIQRSGIPETLESESYSTQTCGSQTNTILLSILIVLLLILLLLILAIYLLFRIKITNEISKAQISMLESARL